MAPPYTVFITISLTCIILTIAAYLYVKKLRNTLGKCLISCLSNIFVWQVLMLVQLWSSAPETARVVSYIFFSAHNLWLSVISYHLWRPFKSVNGEEPSFLFRAYNLFVWVPTAVLLGSPALIYILYGVSNIETICEVKARRWGNYDLLKFGQQSYPYCLRILFVVVLPWFKLIGEICGIMKLRHPVLYVVGFINASYGIWYFILLILNRSTLRLVMDRFRSSPKKEFVRAQRAANEVGQNMTPSSVIRHRGISISVTG
ncbi:G-protein coupled receptor Mth-like [Drosophila subpulchrella]|uniref:G-protein coupled receptor Mth-like n=1 Tax=Drosophila subpulchrella TaxID=1486046 RepID=UPI0018A14A28|nr:G-protein coupled receptor Mth-like [Drosophila subpulchrella]